MKKTNQTILFLTLLIFSAPLFAAHEVIKEKGKPLEIRWDDGRIARYAITTSKLWTGDLPMQVSENTCSSAPATGCSIRAFIQIKMPVIYWEKHTVPERVGKIVKSSSIAPAMEFEIHFPYFLNIDNRLQKVSIASDLPMDQIICENFAWLAEFTAMPDRFLIPRWNVEAMSQNPETGLNENRVIGGGIDVDLVKTGPTSFGIERVASLFGPARTLVQGDIMAWILKRSNGDYCQISLKANVTQANTALLALYYSTLSEFKPTADYLWGSDVFSEGYFPSYFNGFFTNPDSFNPK